MAPVRREQESSFFFLVLQLWRLTRWLVAVYIPVLFAIDVQVMEIVARNVSNLLLNVLYLIELIRQLLALAKELLLVRPLHFVDNSREARPAARG